MPDTPDRSRAGLQPHQYKDIYGGAVGTSTDSWQTDCRYGLLLRHKGLTERGRDYQKYCDSWTCRSCRPFIEKRYLTHLSECFQGRDIYLLEEPDDGWQSLKKQINRAQGEFVKIPAAHKSSALFSTVLGELVSNHQQALEVALQAKPNDKRRVTASRAWQGGWKEEHYWSREGISNLSQYKRLAIYEEEDCKPVIVDSDTTDLTLPPNDSFEWVWIADRLELK